MFFSVCSSVAFKQSSVFTETRIKMYHKYVLTVRTSAIQLQYNCNTRIVFLYCSCIALVWTAAIQQNFLCYVIVVVLHLCGPLYIDSCVCFVFVL